MEFPDHPFWDFSLQTYSAPGVAPACLALQARHGVDVNYLLFCCWLGRAGYGAQGDGRIARLRDVATPWHNDVVRVLRAARKRLKDPFAGTSDELRLALRERLAALEIDAEHVEQLSLAAAMGDVEPREVTTDAGAADAVANLASYFAVAAIEPSSEDRDALQVILISVFPELQADTVKKLAAGLVA